MHCKIEHSMIAVTACRSQLNPDDVDSLLFLNGLSNEYACSSEVAFLVLSFEDIGNGFYRAMHFSAKRCIAIACRLSVCPSVCDVGEL